MSGRGESQFFQAMARWQWDSLTDLCPRQRDDDGCVAFRADPILSVCTDRGFEGQRIDGAMAVRADNAASHGGFLEDILNYCNYIQYIESAKDSEAPSAGDL